MWRNSPLDMFSSGNLFPMMNVGKLLHGEIYPHEKCGHKFVKWKMSPHEKDGENLSRGEISPHERCAENVSSGKILHMINVEKNL